ncbi:DUF3630 family protein [Aeromonas tecta]|uniref:DUF3630 family protein n=1 Tax=Aeromonas tecta TaxID=324617 RepID=UPI0006809A80|nr:DUF3630 family protein [Aeromonas tecta]
MNWRITQINTESAVLMLDCPGLCWDNFPTLAETLLQEWELRPLERDWGADRHSWLLEFEGNQLRLEYEHHSGCWLEAVRPADREVLLWLGRQHKA